jgi:hypothetical protein
MSDYLFRLEVPADKRSFTVAEALEATSTTLHPDSDAEGPVMILSIDKVERLPALNARPTALNEDDWQALRNIWSAMPGPEFPMPAERWQSYLDTFNLSPQKPKGWDLTALQRDPEFQSSLARVITFGEHRDILKRAVNSGAIVLRNPMTSISSELGWVGDAESWLMTRAHMRVFCDLLAIELVDFPPHFVIGAHLMEVPAELLALANDARVSFESNIGGRLTSGRTNAEDLRRLVRATVSRQEEGHFTLEEAAQVLADSHPGIDPLETVKRFLLAHSKGELPIHHGGSRFRREVGETISTFWDTLECTELDHWLRKSAGYGFPIAAAELRVIAGRRLWRLADAIATVAGIPGLGVTEATLMRRALQAAASRNLTLRNVEDGSAVSGDTLSGFLGEWLFAGDLNAWLESQDFSELYRLPDVRTANEVLQKAPTTPATHRPVQRWDAQEAAILDGLRALGFDPMLLPKPGPSEPGPKSKVKKALGTAGMWTGSTVFDKAWERLASGKRIRYSPVLPRNGG